MGDALAPFSGAGRPADDDPRVSDIVAQVIASEVVST